MWQPNGSEPVDSHALAVPLARSLAGHLAQACGDFARLLECRALPEKGIEIVSFELDVGVPQRPVYAINPIETISVGFWPGNDFAPVIAVTRPDFPDTPHQNLVPEGFPSVLCVDDRPWQDIRDSYAASELVARIQIWFAKACEGELHGNEQPFDPIFPYDGAHEVIVTKDGEEAMSAGGKLNVWATDERTRFLLVKAAREGKGEQGHVNVHVLHVGVEAQAMKRMRWAPRTLGQLSELLANRGADLVAALRPSILEWLRLGKTDEDGKWITCIMVSMPQVHPRTREIGAVKPMAFLCEISPGRVGEALGVLGRNPSQEASKVRYVPLMLPTITPDGLNAFPIQVANVHVELDGDRASQIAGRATDLREVVLVGAGSLGSHLAENLVREGLFRWTIVDDDDFLPHNVARHTLTKFHLGQAKAHNLAARVASIRQDAAPRSIRENVLCRPPSAELVEALGKADIILDAAASVPVARWLSDRPEKARRICAFFTPDGRSAVLMAETADRSVNLRDLEAAYLREILTNPSLKDHLRPGQQLRYTGACRALTNKIPASSVSVLSGLLADGVATASGGDSAVLRVWTMREGGSSECLNVPVSSISSTVAEWTITFPAGLHEDLAARRELALPSETGGPLVGLIDLESKHVAAIHALATPPDSAGSRSEFIRGTRGMLRLIEEAQERSGGQVRYIGEWHSHPRGASASPSTTDIRQIGQLSMVLDLDGLPALSMIVGERGLGMLVGKVA
jgi:integrative and conjugative element protein (TIGR02256 family)